MSLDRIEEYEKNMRLRDLTTGQYGTILSVNTKTKIAQVRWDHKETPFTTTVQIPNTMRLEPPAKPLDASDMEIKNPTFICDSCGQKAPGSFGAIQHNPTCMWAFKNGA